MAWALGTTGVIVGSVLLPLLVGVSPLLVLVIGFLVTTAAGLGLADSLDIAAVEPADIQRFVVEIFRQAPADAVCLACCTFRAYDAREAIQRELGVPVVTSNQAALTAALRHLHLAPAAV